MAERVFALEPQGKARLRVTWSGWFPKNIKVLLDDMVIGEFADRKAMQQGDTFAMPDGREIFVQNKVGFGVNEWLIMIDNVPVVSSANSPKAASKKATGVFAFFSAVNLVAGGIGLGGGPLAQMLNLGIGHFVLGLVYVLCAVFTYRQNAWAVLFGLVIYVLDGVLGLLLALNEGLPPTGSGIVFRLILIVILFRSWKVLRSQSVATPAEAERQFSS
jgi:hypothetical protein